MTRIHNLLEAAFTQFAVEVLVESRSGRLPRYAIAEGAG